MLSGAVPQRRAPPRSLARLPCQLDQLWCFPRGQRRKRRWKKIRSELEQQGTDVPVASKSEVWPKSQRDVWVFSKKIS